MFLTEGETCGPCAALDGDQFPIAQGEAGQNLAPLHPNCNCFTAILDPRGDVMAVMGNVAPRDLRQFLRRKGVEAGRNVLFHQLDGGAIVESLTLAPFPLLATDTLGVEYLPVDGSVGVRQALSFAAGFVPVLACPLGLPSGEMSKTLRRRWQAVTPSRGTCFSHGSDGSAWGRPWCPW